VWQRKRIIWVHDLDLRPIDGVAFICDETIMDYVAWKECGILLDGPLYQAAVDAGAWSQRTIVETGPVAIGGGYQSPGLQKGECICRDKDSTDTDSVTDWSFPGEKNARALTPSTQNLDHLAPPVINEVLFCPKAKSKRLYQRRIFVEIYRRDTSYSLNGCTIQNHDGSWHYDFGESFDSVDHSYITIKCMNKEFKLRKSKGILWIRRMPLDNADALALFCDGAMINYVSWSNKGE
jgi:hypothetical protein